MNNEYELGIENGRTVLVTRKTVPIEENEEINILSRKIDRALNILEATKFIIAQQPSKNDEWILNKLNSAILLLKGEN